MTWLSRIKRPVKVRLIVLDVAANVFVEQLQKGENSQADHAKLWRTAVVRFLAAVLLTIFICAVTLAYAFDGTFWRPILAVIIFVILGRELWLIGWDTAFQCLVRRKFKAHLHSSSRVS